MPVAVALIPAAIGAYQAISGHIKARQNEKRLEALNKQSPIYSPNKSILDYYSEAYRRYSTDPTQTAQYKLDAQNIARSTNQGLNALQERRSALGGVNALVQGQNDALLKAGANAENERNRLMGVLGNAAQMKAGEEGKAFQQNKLYPYENQYNLLAMKAGQGATTMNQGISNIGNGLMNAASIYADNQMYQNQSVSQPQVSNYGQQDLAYTYNPNSIAGYNMNRNQGSYNVMGNSYNKFIGPQLYK